MAYLPPDPDEVDFDFVASGYVEPDADAVDFAFAPVAPPRHLLSGRYWKTTGGTQRLLERGERFETLGVYSQIRRHGEHWRTAGVATTLLDRIERWITQSAGSEIVRNERWSTFIPSINETHRDFAFEVTGVRQLVLPSWRRWATDGAPLHLTIRDERWASAAPLVRALDAWRQWI